MDARGTNLPGPANHVLLAVAVALGLWAAGCIRTPETGSAGFIRWAAKNAHPIESLEGPARAAGLAALREMIGEARVVGLGESRHDTREQLLVKSLLVRHLIEELGFRTLILEESFPHAEAIDRYVTSGEGNLRETMNRLAGWYVWDTEEMLDLVEWIRQYNAGRPSAAMVRVFGMDVTAPAEGVREVLDLLRAAGVDVPFDATALGLELQQGDFWPGTWRRYATLDGDQRRALLASYDRLVELVRSRRETLVAASSAGEYERMLRLASIGQAGNALFVATDRRKGAVIREAGMARTALWILGRRGDDGGMIVWAHNLHVARAPFRMPGLAEGTLEPMGMRLAEELGDAYVAIGGAFGGGSYGAHLPPGERTFTAGAEDVMDGALAAVGMPALLLDLREARAGSTAGRWLRHERAWKAQDASAFLVPADAFDMVYFVATVSRSQPTPLALRRFQSLENPH